MGVTSNRVDVKRAAASTERALERRAEPYAALFLPARTWPERLLELAWLRGGPQRRPRLDLRLLGGRRGRRRAPPLRRGPRTSPKAWPPGRSPPWPVDGRARPGGRQPVGPGPHRHGRAGGGRRRARPGPDVQVLSERFGLPGSMTLDAETVRTVLGHDAGSQDRQRRLGAGRPVDEDETGIDLTVAIGPEERPNVPIAEAKQDLYTRLGARPDVAVRVRLDQPPIRRIAARVAEVPGFGWRPSSRHRSPTR